MVAVSQPSSTPPALTLGLPPSDDSLHEADSSDSEVEMIAASMADLRAFSGVEGTERLCVWES